MQRLLAVFVMEYDINGHDSGSVSWPFYSFCKDYDPTFYTLILCVSIKSRRTHLGLA